MKTKSNSGNQPAPSPKTKPDDRDRAAAKLMDKALRSEHRRWNMPLLAWKDGKIVSSQP